MYIYHSINRFLHALNSGIRNNGKEDFWPWTQIVISCMVLQYVQCHETWGVSWHYSHSSGSTESEIKMKPLIMILLMRLTSLHCWPDWVLIGPLSGLLKHRLVPLHIPITSHLLLWKQFLKLSHVLVTFLRTIFGNIKAAAKAVPPHSSLYSLSSPFQHHVSWWLATLRSYHSSDRTEACSSKNFRVGAKEETVSISLEWVQAGSHLY